MSHVDDGTLHAYLDGELSTVEAGRLEAHLESCPACRARLEEERALIERASKLLGLAVPPEPGRAAPPLHELRQPRLTWRIRTPLAWAATVVLALGTGWFARGSLPRPRAVAVGRLDTVATAPPAPAANDVAMQNRQPSLTPSDRAEPRRAAEPAALPSAPLAGAGAAADRALREEESNEPSQAAKAVERLRANQTQPELRGAAPAEPVSGGAVAISQAAPGLAASEADERRSLSATGVAITRQAARHTLGTAPLMIPGYPVRSFRRSALDSADVLVEQEVDSGVVVQLIERRAQQRFPLHDVGIDSLMAKSERLARYVGGLRVEIAGPLPMDSLSKLLELVRAP